MLALRRARHDNKDKRRNSVGEWRESRNGCGGRRLGPAAFHRQHFAAIEVVTVGAGWIIRVDRGHD